MASHSLLHWPVSRRRIYLPPLPQVVRVDAMVLGAVVIAAIMIGGLMLLRDDPGTPRGCRAGLYRDPATGLLQGRAGVRPRGDHVVCGTRGARRLAGS